MGQQYVMPNATADQGFVPDGIRMGQAPVNEGINRENIVKIPQSVSSEAIRDNIKLTFGGQYSQRAPAQIGSISQLPPWMHQYVTIPVKQNDFDRIQQVDFIKSMRQSQDRQHALVDRMENASNVPLLPRQGREFNLRGETEYARKPANGM